MSECDGGHGLSGFDILHYRYYWYYSSDVSFRVRDPNVRNYTITGLSPSTWYYFQLSAFSLDGTMSRRSEETYLSTLPPGKVAIPAVS